MDARRWYDLFGRRPTRRDFLRVSGDVAACLALDSLPIAYDQAARFRENPFTAGVASGDPLPDGVVLWTRLALPPRSRTLGVRWELALDERFSRVVRRGTSPAPPELGHAVHADIGGLQPGREYWYRFVAGGHVSPVGRTKTAPAAGASNDAVRLAFASCQNYEHGYFTAYRHLAAEGLDLVVHLGDYIYEKSYPSTPSIRNHEAAEVITLDDYRGRYAWYRTDPDLQAAHAAAPWVLATDDHEVANNYAGAVPAEGPASPAFLLRRAAAYQAFYEFMPLRRSSMPAGPAMRVYRGLSFGRLVRCLVLDSRQYRSDQPCGDGGKPRCPDAFRAEATMLGAAQERWLEGQLRRSEARWNLMANQVMIAELAQTRNAQMTYSMDRWDGYVAARDRLLEALAGSRVANPVVLTGDIHSSWVADLRRRFDDPRSPVIGAEFVGTSISSGGDGAEGAPDRGQAENPHLKFYNGRRGYVRLHLTPRECRADYRVVPFVSQPGAPIETRASFVVEAGKPGAQPA